MCGIAGIISTEPEKFMQPMLAAIEHRGRDDSGVWTSPVIDDWRRQVCFGHRRLAIIDPSPAGHQPMLSPDGRYVITFNGEIYNYREVREALKSKGHRFHTETDTEVLLAAFAEWGEACLNRLNGMFAFALLDTEEQKLTLVRDHAGIKPLYYTRLDDAAGGTFIFASEVKAILATRLIKAEIAPKSLHQFLTFLWVPDPDTLFKGIHTVPPAHILTYKEDQIQTRAWWDLSFDTIEKGRPDSWWQDQVLETLDRVVRMEMVSDVPLGSFLSGGIDSSAILASMKYQGNGRPIRTYTVGIDANDLRYDIIPDDVQWARRVQQQFGTDYQEIIQKPDVTELLPKLVHHMEEPPVDMAIPSYLIAKAARQSLKVMLSGMGGDEVFAGYPRQLAMKLSAVLDPVPALLCRPLMKTIERTLPGGLAGPLTAPLRNAKKFARSASLTFEDRYLGYGTYFNDQEKSTLYTDDWRRLNQGLDAYVTHRQYFSKVEHAAPLNRLLYVDFKTFLPCLNLMTTDKTSMAANLEVRVPFLNREMLQLAARMPPDLKLRGLKRKYVLKRALEKRLPQEVVWRKKAGFGAPVRSWLRGALRPMVDELLSEETVKRRGLFQPAQVRRLVNENLSGREDYNLQVFQLLGLELWQQTFTD